MIRNKNSCGVYVNSSTEAAPQRYVSPQKKLNVVPAYEALLVAPNPDSNTTVVSPTMVMESRIPDC
jgi:hypothetical protein